MITELENIECNFCKSKDNIIIYRGRLDGSFHKEMFSPTSASFKTGNIVKCKNCGLIFTNPRPKAKILVRFYSEGLDQNYVKQRQERIQTFRRVIKFIESFAQPGRLLDIGCGAGFLLYAAKENGWQVKGIESNKFFANFANTKLKVDAINKTAEQAEFGYGCFDAIVLHDTLEHLLDPYLVLSKSYNWLRKGGYIFINIPNISSIYAKVFRNRWWFIETMHLYYFSPRTINMYFEKIGFKYIRKRPYIQSLKLGYLVSKLRLYSYSFYKLIDDIIRFMNLQNLNISYYAGQTTIVGQK